MLYKPDIERTKKWYEAFWNRETLKRPLLIVQSHRDKVKPYRERLVDPVTQWTDIDYIIEEKDRFFKSRYFAAEAIPHALVGITNGAIAAFLGCDVEFRHETNWFKPVIDDWESYKLNFNPQNKWWKFTKELTSTMVEAGRDKYFVDLPDFQSDMDSLSNMRTPSKLCMDLYSYPDKIKEALNYIFENVYKPTFTEIYKILTKYTSIVSQWMGIISEKRHDVLQADFSALISPKMAEEFVIPNIRKEANFLDRSIFHLDGPGAVDKLDLLLDIKDLGGIQWVPGANNPTAVHWLPMLKKIQKRGKVLCISSPPEEVKDLINELEPRGLIIAVTRHWDVASFPDGITPFRNEHEANEFINQVEKWCKRRWYNDKYYFPESLINEGK